MRIGVDCGLGQWAGAIAGGLHSQFGDLCLGSQLLMLLYPHSDFVRTTCVQCNNTVGIISSLSRRRSTRSPGFMARACACRRAKLRPSLAPNSLLSNSNVYEVFHIVISNTGLRVVVGQEFRDPIVSVVLQGGSLWGGNSENRSEG